MSKRSRFITLCQALTKSLTNFGCESEHAYTSDTALSCAFEPKIRSARVAFHLDLPDFRSLPSKVSCEALVAFHTYFMSKRLTKKSFASVSGRSVKTPKVVPPKLVFSTRKPPI